jgi:dienelactone hydrolase
MGTVCEDLAFRSDWENLFMRLLAVIAVVGLALRCQGAEKSVPPGPEKGTVIFQPQGKQQDIPERYRLDPHQFPFEMVFKQELPVSGVQMFELRFPSPFKSSIPENNTVYAEYYRPNKEGPFPCVIVLDILAGNQKLPRTFCQYLAQNGIAGLFVQMAHYGHRRPAGSSLRLLSYDLEQTHQAVRQTVLDLRRATAWMEARPEIDAHRLGIMGTSLGSFMAALTAEMEPKLGRVAVLLGGGGFVDAYYDDPRVAPYRKVWEGFGGNKDLITQMIAPIDPITHAERLKDRRVLIVAAKNDEIVPPRMAENLWQASGRQQILWLNAGHYSAILYLPTGLKSTVDLFNQK